MSTYYLESHEWARQEGAEFVIGVSEHAANELGEIIHIELPNVGDSVTQKQAIGEIESVKSVSDFYAPVAGTISAVNDALADQPEKVNEAAEGDGWLVKITASDADPTAGLLSAEDYKQQLDS